MTVNLLPMVCAALPGLVLILALYGWQWRDKRRQRRAPVSDKLLRAPGQFLREEIARIDEQMMTTLALFTFAPSMFLAATLRLPSGAQPIQFLVPIVAAIMVSAGGGWRMCKLLGERQRYQLGFSGECAVAEELNKLTAQDCRVFHDLADEKIGNIDHIVVGPTGVYAIETKTRSKVPSMTRQPEHEVSYDGKKLTFPA